MLKINQVFTKLFLLFVTTFSIFFITTYFLLKPQIELLDAYNQTWIKLAIASVVVQVLIYFFIKSVSYKLTQDTEEFQNYLDEVSNKNYHAVIKIKYFHEFLEMSLRLKNIIKRLKNKDTKKK